MVSGPKAANLDCLLQSRWQKWSWRSRRLRAGFGIAKPKNLEYEIKWNAKDGKGKSNGSSLGRVLGATTRYGLGTRFWNVEISIEYGPRASGDRR